MTLLSGVDTRLDAMPLVTRRSIVSCLALPLAAQTPTAALPKVPDRGPALGAEMVKEFVVAAHGNLDKTKSMLAETPSLVYATWDWGGGDFETGLGGASHMGRRDIALFLLENGARMDLFAAAMLGKLEIIKAAASAFPKLQNTLGPHKIPLIVHAKKGGAEAEAVVAFLQTL